MQCAINLINHYDLIWSDGPPFVAKYQTQKKLNCFSWCLLNWHRRTWHLSHRHSYIGTSGMILPLQCCQFAAKTHFDIQQDDRLWLLMEWRPDGGSKFRDCTLRCCQTFLVVWLIQAEAGNLERQSPSVIWSTTYTCILYASRLPIRPLLQAADVTFRLIAVTTICSVNLVIVNLVVLGLDLEVWRFICCLGSSMCISLDPSPFKETSEEHDNWWIAKLVAVLTLNSRVESSLTTRWRRWLCDSRSYSCIAHSVDRWTERDLRRPIHFARIWICLCQRCESGLDFRP